MLRRPAERPQSKDRGLSLRKAAKLIGKSDSWLAHLETGRFDPKPHDYKQVASIFDLSLSKLQKEVATLKEDELINVREECMVIISRMPQEKLNAFYQMLKVF